MELYSNTINVGLELEYEGVSHRTALNRMQRSRSNSDSILWHFKSDGSLRPPSSNTEMTFLCPLQGDMIKYALNQLEVFLPVAQFTTSWRCGMHVHVDHTGMSRHTAYRQLVLGCMLEDVLYKWAGEERKESKFCPPVSRIAESLWSKPPGRRKSFNPKKYSGINLANIYGTGSVEHRFGVSSLDINYILGYINIGMALRDLGAMFDDSMAIINSVLRSPNYASWVHDNVREPVRSVLMPAAEEAGAFTSTNVLNAATFLAENEQHLKAGPVGLAPHIFDE